MNCAVSKYTHIWTEKEDQMLIQFFNQTNCFKKWKVVTALFKQQGILKTELQCRNRYVNYKNPELKHGKLSNKQIQQLFECYNQYGSQWRIFETHLKGRSQSNLKNMFYSILRSILRIFVKNGRKMNIFPLNIKFERMKVKDLSSLYQGRDNFREVDCFFKNCIQSLNYNFNRCAIKEYFKKQKPNKLKKIYQVLRQNCKYCTERSECHIEIANQSISIPKMKIQNKEDYLIEHEAIEKLEPQQDQMIYRSTEYGMSFPLTCIPSQYYFYPVSCFY